MGSLLVTEKLLSNSSTLKCEAITLIQMRDSLGLWLKCILGIQSRPLQGEWKCGGSWIWRERCFAFSVEADFLRSKQLHGAPWRESAPAGKSERSKFPEIPKQRDSKKMCTGVMAGGAFQCTSPVGKQEAHTISIRSWSTQKKTQWSWLKTWSWLEPSSLYSNVGSKALREDWAACESWRETVQSASLCLGCW